MRNRAGPLVTIGLSMILAMMAACGILGAPKAETFESKVAAAYLTIGGVRDTGRRLLQGNKIGPDDAQVVQDRADEMRAAVEVAREIEKTSEAGGQSSLAKVLQLAQIVTDCLTEREQPRAPDAEPLPSMAVCIQQREPQT